MTVRPVFVSLDVGQLLVKELPVSFQWYPGFSVAQKKRSIQSFHAAARLRHLAPLLEISTKSDDPIGQSLSAFNFEVQLADGRFSKLESVYHSSKVFERGGPFVDLMGKPPLEAKRDPRLRSHGSLVAFELGGRRFPLLPRRAFYDWLYIRALAQKPNLVEKAGHFEGFTDIEFNPEKSLNSQAHAVALAVALQRRGWLQRAAKSFSGVAYLLSHSAEEMFDVSSPGSLLGDPVDP
jgi:hypothetical protein